VRCDESGVPSESLAKTRTPPEQEKGGVLGNPHRRLPGEPEGLRRSRRIGLHSPDSSGNKVTIEHRRAFGATNRLDEEVAESNDNLHRARRRRLSSITRAPCRKVMGVPCQCSHAAR